MEIVTGDRYLDMLARFVEDNVAALLDGSMVLKLNPLGLHYLQARLDSLQELERLRTAAPVDYLRAYVADLGDHRALELLRRVLRLLGSVKVVSALQTPGRDPTPISLMPFGRLKTLELRGCDLSTSAARGLLQLRPHLKKIICHNSTDALRHVFAERIVEIKNSEAWTRLASVSCACNGIFVMDESLQLLPAVEVLDLKRNKLTHVSNLRSCTRLKFLDLSFNYIQSVSMIEQASASLRTLILRFNALSSTKGIDKLYFLEYLDLSDNIISSFHELERLSNLCFLSSLVLQGNPVTFARGYRQKTFSALADPLKVCLDGKTMSRIESWAVHKLLVNKTKQEGGFGLYAPAVKPVAAGDLEEENDAVVCKGKKKEPRLAVIEDEEARKRMEHIHEYAAPLDVEAGLVNPVEAVESKLQQLMRRVKKDKSALWLTEISKIFETGAIKQTDKAPVRTRSRRRRRDWVAGPSASGEPEATEDLPNISQLQLENFTEAHLSHGSPASPPQFNTEVLQRRQDLEEELLKLRATSGDSTSGVSDSSTSSPSESELVVNIQDTKTKDATVVDNEEEVRRKGAADDVASTSGAKGTLLVEDSCFLDPMWVGSVLSSQQDNGGSVEASVVEVSTSESGFKISSGLKKKRSSSLQKMRKSRQAWRVVPLEYEGPPLYRSRSDGQSVDSTQAEDE